MGHLRDAVANSSGPARPGLRPEPPRYNPPVMDASPIAIAELASQIRGQLRLSPHERMLYATDASIYQVPSLGVVHPADVDEMSTIAAFCNEHGIALLPRGGGTSLAGQCTNRALVMDYSPTCRKVLEVNAQDRWCRVEPGIVLDDLNREIAHTGLFFAPDPATSAQCAIGGCIGNNAAGARSIRYGRTSDNVIELDIALADGRTTTLGRGAGARDAVARKLAAGVIEIVKQNAAAIRERFPRTSRRNAGYALDMILKQIDAGATADDIDLTPLLCGSEGTLAITRRAKLKLHPIPRAKGLAIASFPTLEDAIAAVPACLTTGCTAVELIDDVVLEAARGNTECQRFLDVAPLVSGNPPAAILYVEYQELTADEVQAGFDRLRGVLGEWPILYHTSAIAMGKAWALRKAGEPLLHGLAGHRKPVTCVEDNAVPVENLYRFVAEFKRIVARHGTKAAYYAHAAVGVLHVRPLLDLHDEKDREHLRGIAQEVAALARQCGGVMSGEHGDGRIRGPLLREFFGPDIMGAFAQVKRLFDARNILNPGNIADPGDIASITQHLRVLPEAGKPLTFRPVDTYYDYSHHEGFGAALELCSGAGVCRKTAGGTMCPSYRATLDERHATRGRGNALRLAISGQIGVKAPAWNDPATMETLRLCLSCKACKSECPSNVDVAQLKAEYLAQSYKAAGGAPLSAKAFGHVRTLNKLASIFPTFSNWLMRRPLVRDAMKHLLNIDPRRSMPKYEKPLHRQFKSGKVSPAIARPKVVLFPDCFITYNEPRIGLSAARVLERLGYEVILPKTDCCGRSLISMGLLAEAIKSADKVLSQLRPYIEDESAAAILVAEPSCLAAFRDDYLDLKCTTPLALRRKLAEKSFLIEQFIEDRWDKHPTPAHITPDGAQPPVLLHAHCHQKSLWTAETSARLLRRLCGSRLSVLDTGCCGMAGSFGFTADRYDLSMQIGELSLLPMVRAAAPDAIIVAPGTSCRHQIHDGTGRAAIHPIELAERILCP